MALGLARQPNWVVSRLVQASRHGMQSSRRGNSGSRVSHLLAWPLVSTPQLYGPFECLRLPDAIPAFCARFSAPATRLGAAGDANRARVL